MKPLPSQPDPLDRLLTALMDGELTPEEFDQLQMRLSQDSAAQAYYRQYMRLCALLEFEHAKAREQEDVRTGAASESPVPPIVHPLTAIPPPFGAISSSFPGMLLSYAFAILILCVGMLAAWAWQTTSRATVGSFAKAPTPPAGRTPDASRRLLATITATENCVWHPAAEAASGQIILRSGAVEITYSSGVKILLEGPVSYQVASPNGGFLRQGKLTVYVPRKGSGGKVLGAGIGLQRSKPDQGSSSPSLDAPLFTLHTPNAVLTDRGGTLGIWVDHSGDCHCYVFDGHVDVQLSGHRYEKSSPLEKNYWAWVKRAADGRRTVFCGTGEPLEGFARQVLVQPPVATDATNLKSGVGAQFRIYQF